jgi:hypothetical protein
VSEKNAVMASSRAPSDCLVSSEQGKVQVTHKNGMLALRLPKRDVTRPQEAAIAD